MEAVAVGDLVSRAGEGDERAWEALVSRYLGLVHAVCRGHRLTQDDAAEVNRVVWLRLVEHLDRIRTPEAVGGWIAATARVECLRVLRSTGRLGGFGGVDLGDDDLDVAEDADTGVDVGLLVYERDRTLMAAFGHLGGRCQQLLRLLMADPAPVPADVAAALDMPVASIGPARTRCLEQLRQGLA